MAEIGDIKKSELVRIISQPLAAKVSYIELMQLLAENDFHTTRMSEWRGADRDDVKDAVSDFKYGEEALVCIPNLFISYSLLPGSGIWIYFYIGLIYQNRDNPLQAIANFLSSTALSGRNLQE